jgi:uncharacterized protein YggE
MSIVPDTTRAIYVTGRGMVTVRPDMASVELGVFVLDHDLRKAKTEADDILKLLIALTNRLGVPNSDLVTSNLLVNPRYANDDDTKFQGYEVTRTLTVTLHDLSNLERLLDGAVAAGANRNFDVDLKTSRELDLKKEAMARAIDDAKEQAVFVATRLGFKVGSVRSVNLNKSFTTTSMAATYGAPTATFLPADVKLDAEVSVTFYLADGSS